VPQLQESKMTQNDYMLSKIWATFIC